MSIYKPTRSPYYHYDFVWKSRRFFGSTGSANPDDARAVEAAERRKAVLGEHYPERRRMTLDEAFGRYWTEVAEGQASARTTWGYLDRLSAGLGKLTFVDELDEAKLADHVASARGRKNGSITKKKARLVAPATVNREVECLRRVMRRARKVWKVATPEIDWKELRLTEPDERVVALPADAEERVIAAAAPHLRPAIKFALLTGVRLQNAVKLDWSQVDMANRVIRFHVKSKKPGGRLVIIPISIAVRALLGTLEPKESGAVFTYWTMRKGKRTAGRPIKTTWRKAWLGALRRAGLPHMRWHDLRHTFGTRLMRVRAGLKQTKDLMGHADIRSTLRYQHYDIEDRLSTLELLAEASPRTIPEAPKLALPKARKAQ